MDRPDPHTCIRILAVRTLRGANYWTSFPVSRLDLTIGEYETISSADIPGVTEALLSALPGLVEHRCSIGERGGFVTRLGRGTYAPHIIEHIALELQEMVGDEVGYGRARGGDREGEYTVVVEHRHGRLGMEAVRAATGLVTEAFAGTPLPMTEVLATLQEVRRGRDDPPLEAKVDCGILGSGDLDSVRRVLDRCGVPCDSTIGVRPDEVLLAGLPYAASDTAVLLAIDPEDVPPRYREKERRARIAAVAADAVAPRGVVIVPAREWEIQELVREAGQRVAIFAGEEDVTSDDARLAQALARVRGDSIVIETAGRETTAVPLREGGDPAYQAAAALAQWALRDGNLG